MIEQFLGYCKLEMLKVKTIGKKPICFLLIVIFFNDKDFSTGSLSFF